MKKRVLVMSILVPLGMFALAFAAEPLYGTFCRVTGFGGTTRTALAPAKHMLEREILIRFDSNIAADLPIGFRPGQSEMRLRLGETGMAYFVLDHAGSEPIDMIASYNVTPHKMGVFFRKLECFCFEKKSIAPGMDQRLPVIFYIDPALDDTARFDDVRAVTLSYTFFRAGKERAARDQQTLLARR